MADNSFQNSFQSEIVLREAFGFVLDPLSDGIEILSTHTGLRWGPTERVLFFYRKPVIHAFELIVFQIFIFGFYRMSAGYVAGVVSHAPRSMPTSNVNRCIGAIMLALWISEVFMHIVRDVPVLLQPHEMLPQQVASLSWVYVFLIAKPREKNYYLCVYIASLLSGTLWIPLSSLISLDVHNSSHVVEFVILVANHVLRVLVPLYFAARYELLPLTVHYLIHVCWVVIFMNANVYTLASYVTGLNVNYQLFPPLTHSKQPVFDTPFYRFYGAVAVVFLILLCRVSIGVGGWFLHAAAVLQSRRNKSL